MNYSCGFADIESATGARQPENIGSGKSIWNELWGSLVGASIGQRVLSFSTTITQSIITQSMPVRSQDDGRSTADMVCDVQDFFGLNIKETADVLNVSRPMIYHYQKGMKPDLDNKRRLALLVSITEEWKAFDTALIHDYLKVSQPEGGTLLDYLSDKEINVTTIREIVSRATSSDRRMRKTLAENIIGGETPEQKTDIARERAAAGKVVYVGDSTFPDKVVQVHPDGTRIIGRMLGRKFVSDGE